MTWFRIDSDFSSSDHETMVRTVEFETELTGGHTLNIPAEVAETLPSTGKATIVLFVEADPEDSTWRLAAYERFLKDDSEEDAVYDKYG